MLAVEHVSEGVLALCACGELQEIIVLSKNNDLQRVVVALM